MIEMVTKDIYKKDRVLYIFQAIFENLISILVGGTYLAKVTTAIGIDDSLTAVLTSLTCLGCAFQLFAIFLSGKRRVKRCITILHTLNQFFFAIVFFVPFFPVSYGYKVVFFMAFLLIGHIINYIAYQPKVNWYMSFVEDCKRGRFTATKDAIFRVCEVAFSLLMGFLVDYYEAQGNMNAAFLCFGIALLVLMALHTTTLLLTKEKPQMQEAQENIPLKAQVKELLKNPKLYKLALVFNLWTVAQFVTTPFYGTYQIAELGFSMSFASALVVVTALSHAIAAKPLGKLADKRSFAFMLSVSFLFMLSAFAINVFATPANGKVLFTLYSVLFGVGFAGINSATINLVYDYIQEKHRVCALALIGTISGLVGFMGTLAVTPLFEYIQANNNTFLGLNLYAQQVLSALGVLIIGGILIYLNTVIKKMPKDE